MAETVCWARARFAFEAKEAGGLSLAEGTTLRVHQKAPSGWWNGCYVEDPTRAGWFPASHVEEVDFQTLGPSAEAKPAPPPVVQKPTVTSKKPVGGVAVLPGAVAEELAKRRDALQQAVSGLSSGAPSAEVIPVGVKADRLVGATEQVMADVAAKLASCKQHELTETTIQSTDTMAAVLRVCNSIAAQQSRTDRSAVLAAAKMCGSAMTEVINTILRDGTSEDKALDLAATIDVLRLVLKALEVRCCHCLVISRDCFLLTMFLAERCISSKRRASAIEKGICLVLVFSQDTG